MSALASPGRSHPTHLLAALLAVGLLLGGLTSATIASAGELVSIIVRTAPGAGTAAVETVEASGGAVTREYGALHGFAADLPIHAVADVAAAPGVVSVTRDVRIHALGKPGGKTGGGKTGGTTTCDQLSKCVPAGQSVGSIKTAAYVTSAAEAWGRGYTGAGIDVAVIDTGITNVPGLDAPGKVVDGPDLSFDGQDPELAHEDGFGHGTHLAGIIAGRDAGIPAGAESSAIGGEFLGIAPDARLIDVKVGAHDGAVDVSQVIAALDWVIQHRRSGDLDIRVVNLAFGTNGRQSHVLDPLAYAVEVAWRHGIVVVTAAGNSGHVDGRLTNPAVDPYVIAVGALDHAGTHQVNDDVVPSWSSRGDGVRNPDVVAPGRSIESLLVPGSAAARDYPEAVVGGGRLIKGSGTSQAAAIVSGLVAQFLEAHPTATPDQVKYALRNTAANVPSADAQAQGRGLVKVRMAITDGPEKSPKHVQTHTPATGLGLLELARGDAHVVAPDGTVLNGEVTVTGSTWSGSTWSGSTWSGSTWSGSTWSGSTWSTGDWLGSTWSGSTWSGSTWSGSTWSGSTWSGSTWSGSTWSGSTWSSAGWMGSTWE